MISRRVVQTILGLVWFIDGMLQLKPQMFTSAFIKQVILPTAGGQPHWIAAMVNWGAGIAMGHIVVLDGMFAGIQLLLGIALIFNFKVKATIVFSIAWSSIVWVFGEGMGQLLTGQATLLTGAPGAAAIYALVGISIWPGKHTEASTWRKQGTRFAQVALASLLLLGFALHFQPNYLSSNAFAQQMAVSWLANEMGSAGVVVSMILGLIELTLAVMLLFKLRVRLAVWVAIILSLTVWWAGQMFGQIFQPVATDFNSGLLLILLALCAFPWLLVGDHRLVRGEHALDVTRS